MAKLAKVYLKNSRFLISFLFLFTFLVLFIVKKSSTPLVIIVPHHDAVKDIRSDFFTQIRSKRSNIKTIIVIGPDHFSPYQNQIFYANKPWYFNDKPINFHSEYTNYLNNIDIHLYNYLVQSDHAIMALVPDIINNFPQTNIVPILIGQKVDQPKLDELTSVLIDQCQSNCLLVSSVDVSHYLPFPLADIHDQTSLNALENFDLDKILKLEVDSPQSLYTLAKFAWANKANYFKLFAHTNSAKLADNSDLESTSHIFGYYTRKLSSTKPTNIHTFLYTPDILPSQSKLVGDRFFYGTDIADFNLNQDLLSNQSLPLVYDPNIIIAGSIYNNIYSLVILPFTYQDSYPVLLRGDQKSVALSTYFNKLDLSIFTDYSFKDGTLTYVQEN